MSEWAGLVASPLKTVAGAGDGSDNRVPDWVSASDNLKVIVGDAVYVVLCERGTMINSPIVYPFLKDRNTVYW